MGFDDCECCFEAFSEVRRKYAHALAIHKMLINYLQHPSSMPNVCKHDGNMLYGIYSDPSQRELQIVMTQILCYDAIYVSLQRTKNMQIYHH